jgi:hypothetical protein
MLQYEVYLEHKSYSSAWYQLVEPTIAEVLRKYYIHLNRFNCTEKRIHYNAA